MDLTVILAIVAGLFLAIALAEPIAARLRLPLAVVLAGLGIGIGLAASWFWATELTDALNPVALAILNLPISSDIFIYILLPVLLFEVALSLNLRRLMDDWVPVLTLAVLAVVLATFAIGFALQPFVAVPLAACLMIGAIVSTTDPSAVVSIFRATPAPQRLARIVEGESLLNDAAAIALFSLFLTAVTLRDAEPDIPAALQTMPLLIAIGALCGWLAARLSMILMAAMNPWPMAQISVSFAVPFVAFLLADKGFHASGVVAVVVAGMTINFTAAGRLSPQSLTLLRDSWGLIAYWAGGMIFMLAALLVPRILAQARVEDILPVAITIAMCFVTRAVILYLILPALAALRLSPKVEQPYRIAILWGGLRGAVTLALALSVTENPAIFAEVKRQTGVIATGVVLFTLLVQGTTLRTVIHWLGLDRLTPLDRALADQVVAVALQSVRENLAETTKQLSLTPAIVREEAKRFGDVVNVAVDRAEEGQDILDRDRVTLGLVALAGRERDLILGAFRDDLLTARMADRMLADADRLIEATRNEGRVGYGAQARRALLGGRVMTLAAWAHNRLRIRWLLERATSDRFAFLVAHAQMLRALDRFIDRRILRIHGRRVADLLHDLIRRRSADTARAIEGLRLQFPGYAEELERRLIRRLKLGAEEREYDQLTDDGLIGPELRMSLRDRTGVARAELAKPPRLSLSRQRSDIVRAFPLFAGLGDAALDRLTRAMTTIYAKPGDVLMRKEDFPDRVWFIASGAVETEQAGQRALLGRGEMFGHLSILLRKNRRAKAVAISHTTLVTLGGQQFRDLLQNAPDLSQAVQESAQARGVALDLENLPRPAPQRDPHFPEGFDTAARDLWRKWQPKLQRLAKRFRRA